MTYLETYKNACKVIAQQIFFRRHDAYVSRPSCSSLGFVPLLHNVRGLSGNYPAILNISRTGLVALM